MKRLRRLRWLPPVVLAAIGGIMLAIRTHDGEVVAAGGEVDPPAAQSRSGPDDPTTPRATDASATASTPQPEPRPQPESGSEPPDVEQLEQHRQALLERAGNDPQAALQALVSLDDYQRSYLEEEVVRRAAEQAGDEALQWIHNNVADDAVRERLLTAAYAGMARRHPTFAMNGAQSLQGDDARRLAVGQVLQAWAEEDPVAAFDWVQSRTEKGSGDLLTTVLRSYAQAHPRQAGELIAGLEAGPVRDRLVDGYVHELAGSDPAAAMEWLSHLGEEAPTHSAMASIFDRWARNDPLAAIDYAAASVEGEASYELVGRVASEVGATQPQALAESLHRLPASHRELAVERLAVTWASNHPRRAREWAEALPEGELRDSAIRGIVKIAKYQAPEEALALARMVSEGSEREVLIGDVEAHIRALGSEGGADHTPGPAQSDSPGSTI